MIALCLAGSAAELPDHECSTMAEALSSGYDFLRVDLSDIANCGVFGELTVYRVGNGA
jgi:hypothetical protein